MAEHAIGVVGLATMGMNLARNLASHGASVAVYNRTRKRTDEFMAAYAGEGDFHAAFTLDELQKFLKDKLGKHEMVQALEIRAELPKTAVGKISKKELYDEEERKTAARA